MVDGDYSVAIKEAEDFVVSNPDSFLTGDYPWRNEGTKTLGFEIADQLYWRIPDCVVVPVGNGTLIWSVFEAFRELVLVGITDRIPRIIGVQVENCEAVRVSDKAALSARDILASNGIFVEPSGAVSYAGVMKKKLSGTIVAVATGHGLKDMIRI